METSWTTFKKNINFSEYEENMKEKNQEILDEKNPSTTKTKIKKKTSNLSLFGYSAIPKAAMVLEGQNFAHLHEKRMIFFCFKCFILPHIKNSNDSSNADDFMFKKKIFFSVFKKKNCTDFFV